MQRRTFFAAALVALAGAVACGGPASRFEEARDLALSGHAHAALLEARAVLFSLGDRRDPESDTLRRQALKLAGDLCAVRLDDPRCAANEYRQLVRRYPTSTEAEDARDRLGDLDVRLGDLRGALEAWREQVATSPESPVSELAQLKLARLFLDHGDFEEARRAAAELRSRWPKSAQAPRAALLAASSYHLEGRHEEAAAAYRDVATRYPSTTAGAEALFERGNCLVELGNDPEAVKAYLASLPKTDSPDQVQYALGRAQRRLTLGRAVDPRNQAAVWDRGARARATLSAKR